MGKIPVCHNPKATNLKDNSKVDNLCPKWSLQLCILRNYPLPSRSVWTFLLFTSKQTKLPSLCEYVRTEYQVKFSEVLKSWTRAQCLISQSWICSRNPNPSPTLKTQHLALSSKHLVFTLAWSCPSSPVKKGTIKSAWHCMCEKKSVVFVDKPFLELFWGDQACSEVGISNTLRLPPCRIILAYNFQDVSSLKWQPSLLARNGSVFFGIIAEKRPHKHL